MVIVINKVLGMEDPLKVFTGQPKPFSPLSTNCHDASKYMIELNRKYADRGLSIVGLAFELSR